MSTMLGYENTTEIFCILKLQYILCTIKSVKISWDLYRTINFFVVYLNTSLQTFETFHIVVESNMNLNLKCLCAFPISQNIPRNLLQAMLDKGNIPFCSKGQLNSEWI